MDLNSKKKARTHTAWCAKNKLKNLLAIFILSLLPGAFYAQGQTVHVQAENLPLNEVFIDLRDTYGVQFSFNHQLLQKCIVNESSTFASMDEALEKLLSPCALTFKKNNGIYLILEQPETDKPEPEKFVFQGKITDRLSGESLPYTNIYLGKNGLVSDGNGRFVYKSTSRELRLQASHIGYNGIDTMIQAGRGHAIALSPGSISLREVDIVASVKDSMSLMVSKRVGETKLNHRLATVLPGSSDNTLFNLLRLQAGVLASGEQTKDFFIWGSYKGQSHIIFDGITLFNVTSLNDHIGVVNPLITKNITVYKGGYNVDVGDRTGGVVDITGTDGSTDKVHGDFKLNNLTVSGLLSAPIGKRSAVQGAFRKTMYRFYREDNLDRLYTTVPYHDFQDYNLKYSGETKGGDVYLVSFLGMSETGKYKSGFNATDRLFDNTTTIDNKQNGGSFQYNKQWKRSGNTEVLAAYSNSQSDLINFWVYDENDFADSSIVSTTAVDNGVSEASLKITHRFPATERNLWSVGAFAIENETSLVLDSAGSTTKNITETGTRIGFFIKDEIRLNPRLALKPGLRIDRFRQDKPYIQPRLELDGQITDELAFKLAAGNYRQFITENAFVDSYGNEFHYWSIGDGKTLIPPQSNHFVGGLAWAKNQISLSVEGYYKTYDHLNRWVYNYQNPTEPELLKFSGRSIGMDVAAKQRFGKHELHLAYSLSKTEETPDARPWLGYQDAPHDQRHEVKGALLLNFDPFHVSLNHVYGSGLPSANRFQPTERQPYNRFDAALLYRKRLKKFGFETGFSILNVFGTENIRYNNYNSFPGNGFIYESGVPFTPTVFLNIGF